MIPLEIFIVASILVFLLIFYLLPYLTGINILMVGMTFIILGLSFGVPVGLYYHLLLFQRKRLVGQKLKTWWINPQRYHKYLTDEEQRALNRWFWIGALFFNLSLVGCGLVFISLFKE